MVGFVAPIVWLALTKIAQMRFWLLHHNRLLCNLVIDDNFLEDLKILPSLSIAWVSLQSYCLGSNWQIFQTSFQIIGTHLGTLHFYSSFVMVLPEIEPFIARIPDEMRTHTGAEGFRTGGLNYGIDS